MFSNSFSSTRNASRKILILAAFPQDAQGVNFLRVDVEIREIEEAIRRALGRDQFTIQIATAVRPDDIRRKIAEEQPYIVHFCGHGTESGCLVLEDHNGRPQFLKLEALAALFRMHQQYVQCVLLNACYSEPIAEAISQHIGFVVGMNQTIRDRSAIEFAKGFYDHLGRGNPDDFLRAFDEGILTIEFANLPDANLPVYKCRYRIPPPIVTEPMPRSYPKPSGTQLEPQPARPSGAYTRLRELLVAKQWKNADLETSRIILQISGREQDRLLTNQDIDNLNCGDLRVLDNLWKNNSNSKFGLSVQRDIWLSVQGQPGEFDATIFVKFGERVGWFVDRQWIEDYDALFTQDPPAGHLPSLRFTDPNASGWLSNWKSHFESFLRVVERCLVQ